MMKRALNVVGLALLAAIAICTILAQSQSSRAAAPVNGVKGAPVFTPSPPPPTPSLSPTMTPPCGLAWRGVPHPAPSAAATIHGMDTIAQNDVWAVGEQLSGSYDGYTEHWDGLAWTAIPIEPPGGDYSRFYGMEAYASDDVWAVGHIGYIFGNLALGTLTEHWNGSTWEAVPSPNVGERYNELDGVAEIAPNDVWAVGWSYTTDERTLIMHWNGSSWQVVPSPNMLPYYNYLTAVSAVSANDVWAVGIYSAWPNGDRPLTMHWDGSSWSIVPTPPLSHTLGQLYTIEAIASDDVWAAGDTNEYTLLLHWDGVGWTEISNPYSFTVSDLSAVSATDIWAVGSINSIHWNGSQWALVGTLGNYTLNAVTATTEQVWASAVVMERYNDPCSTPTSTPTATVTVTGTPPTATNTRTPTTTRTVTNTRTPSGTPTASPTTYHSPTPTATNTRTRTTTRTVTNTGTPSGTPANTPTVNPSPTTSLLCWAYTNLGTTACSDPAGGVYTYTATLQAFCSECVLGITLDYTATLLVAPDPYATFTPFYQAPAQHVTFGCGYHTLNVTNTLSVGAIPPPNTVYEIRLDYRSSWGQYGSQYSAVEPICEVAAPTSTPSPTIGAPTATPYIDLYPAQYLELDCRGQPSQYQFLTLTQPFVGLPVTTTMHVQSSSGDFRDYTVPPGPSWYLAFCPYPCLAGSPPFTLTVDYTNQINETNESNNSTSYAQLITPTPCPPLQSPTPSPTMCVVPFSDVPPGSTFFVYVNCLACRGIVNGYPDGTFKPNNSVTRGQLSKIVSNSAGFNDPQDTQMFQDVPVGSTFQVYIGRLASRGYISGYPCGGADERCVPPHNLPYFRPNNNATRGQISKIVSNAAGFSDPPGRQLFWDVSIWSPFYTYTNRLASRGIISGYPCGGPQEPCVPPDNLPYFRPNNNATRGQTSKIVANTFFPDCESRAR